MSYRDALKDDEKLQSLDTRTAEVMKGFTGGRGLSIDSFKAITEFLRDWNDQAVEAILNYKDLVWDGIISNSELSKLIQDYFQCSSQNLSFLSELDNFVMAAADSQALITHVVGQYYENHALVEVEKMKGISENLKNLKAYIVSGDDHSAVGFLQKVQVLQAQQNKLLDNLIKENEKLDKLKSENQLNTKQEKARTKARTIMFVSIGLGLIAFAAVAGAVAPFVLHLGIAATAHITGAAGVAAASHAHGAAVGAAAASHAHGAAAGVAASHAHGAAAGVAASHVHGAATVSATGMASVAGLAGAATQILGNHWLSPLLAEYTALQAKGDVINSMRTGAMAVIKEWGEIESHLHKVLGSTDSLLRNANQANYTGVKTAVDNMKKNLENFKENTADLQTKSSTCAAEIKRTRADVLKAMNSPRPKK